MCDIIELETWDRRIENLAEQYAEILIKDQEFQKLNKIDLRRTLLYASNKFCKELKDYLYLKIVNKKIPAPNSISQEIIS